MSMLPLSKAMKPGRLHYAHPVQRMFPILVSPLLVDNSHVMRPEIMDRIAVEVYLIWNWIPSVGVVWRPVEAVSSALETFLEPSFG